MQIIKSLCEILRKVLHETTCSEIASLIGYGIALKCLHEVKFKGIKLQNYHYVQCWFCYADLWSPSNLPGPPRINMIEGNIDTEREAEIFHFQCFKLPFGTSEHCGKIHC